MSCAHEFYWYAATNEDGWRCSMCDFKPGEPPGFDPQRDRDDIRTKVECILHDLHAADVIYVSNGCHGDAIAGGVSERCREENRFDSYSIALYIIEGLSESHAKYWAEVSEGVLSGNDPRQRCHCGKLARMYTGDRAFCSFDCERQTEIPF